MAKKLTQGTALKQYEEAPIVSEYPLSADSPVVAPIRIAIVVTHAIQYLVPYYRALSARPGVTLKVFFCRRWGAEAYYDRDFCRHVKWDLPMLDGYEWEVLKFTGDGKQHGFWAVDNPEVGDALRKFRPDIVEIGGYAHRTMLRSIRWCNRNGVPVILSSDSNSVARRVWWKRALKTVVVGNIYSRLDGVFSNGHNNRAYHVHYGMPADRIFQRPLPVDCRGIVSSVGDLSAARKEIRQKHGIPQDAFVAIFAGKLSSIKCPLHLLQAVQICGRKGLNVWGLVVGEGSERPTLERHIAEHRLKNVVLAGFVNQSVITRYFAASDVLTLMSSHEAKGQVVPESGSLGRPAILSDQVGCIGPDDCARPGENALVYPWGNIDAFSLHIARLHEDEYLYRSMSEAAVRIANLQDASVVAAQMEQAARQLNQIGSRR